MSFGKYTIVERLGVGGMAEVWLCRLRSIGGFEKPVVIKRILPAMAADPEFVRMFLDEARVVASLNHANIVHVYDIDEADNAPFLVMEYVQGPNLSTLIKEARRQSGVIIAHGVRILADICAGLHAAHNSRDANGELLQLVHRDVSPHNIMISVEGVAKLVDFGVAKSRGRSTTTQIGAIKGKVAYMAPEQASPRGEIDHRADVYSVGVCLYQATTGRLPFEADNDASLLMQVLTGSYRSPTDVVPDFPIELENIIEWAMERDPEARCPSALALQQALDSFVATNSQYASSPATLAQWVNELFPAGVYKPSSSQSRGTPNSSFPGLSAARSRLKATPAALDPGLPPAPQAPPSEEVADVTEFDFVPEARVLTKPTPAPAGSPWRLIAGAALAVAVVVATIVVVMKPGMPPAPVVEDPAVAGRLYLQEATQQVGQRQFGVAAELIAKAREAGARSPSLQIEIAKLASVLQRETALDRMRRAEAAGDFERAAEYASGVLATDPTNEAAARTLQGAHERQAPAPAPPAAPSEPPSPPSNKAVTKASPPPREPADHAAEPKSSPLAAPTTFDAEGLLPSNPDALLPTESK